MTGDSGAMSAQQYSSNAPQHGCESLEAQLGEKVGPLLYSKAL